MITDKRKTGRQCTATQFSRYCPADSTNGRTDSTFFNERGNGERVMNFPYRPRVNDFGRCGFTMQRINRVRIRTLSNPVYKRLQTEKKRKSGLTYSYTLTRHATETHYPFT